MSPTKLTLPSYAKINWTLRVLGRRDDGLHEIETVFQTVSLCDQLSFEHDAGGQLELTSNAADLPLDDRNLIIKAARALRERYGIAAAGARVHLEKRIPAGGGLGGGSSNAAVTLLALARLWRLAVAHDELLALGSQLGADVPFFLFGGTALGVGTGGEVHPLDDAPPAQLLIVTPPVKVLTGEAYEALGAPALTTNRQEIKLTVLRAEDQIRSFGTTALHNDFEATVLPAHPEILRARAALSAAGARTALLSGSGASVFGLFDNQEALARAEAVLTKEAGWLVFPCVTVDRAAYVKALA